MLYHLSADMPHHHKRDIWKWQKIYLVKLHRPAKMETGYARCTETMVIITGKILVSQIRRDKTSITNDLMLQSRHRPLLFLLVLPAFNMAHKGALETPGRGYSRDRADWLQPRKSFLDIDFMTSCCLLVSVRPFLSRRRRGFRWLGHETVCTW
jgi:hypothetical protein